MQQLDFHVSDTLQIQAFVDPTSKNKTIAATFTPSNNKNLDGYGYAGKLLARSGFDLIAFKSSVDNWWQTVPEEVFERLETFMQLRGYTRRVGYGSSMGGFGAIAFSGRLGLDTVLSFSPQFAINQDFDRRWQAFGKQIRWRYEITSSRLHARCKYFVFYDPRDGDRLHVQRLAELVNAEQLLTVEMPHCGHPCIHFLSESGALKEISLQVLANDHLPEIDFRAGRSRSRTYLVHLGKRLMYRGRTATALDIIDRALALDANNVAALWAKIDLLKRLGRADESAALMRKMTVEQTNPRSFVDVSRKLFKDGKFDEALTAIDIALAIHPSSAGFLRQKAMLLERLGRLQEAIACARQAILSAPADPNLHAFLSKLLAKSGQWAHALAAINAALKIEPASGPNLREKSFLLGKLDHSERAQTVARSAVALAHRSK